MDPDGKRILQWPQQKYSKDATEPLKEIMVVDYDTQYLDGTILTMILGCYPRRETSVCKTYPQTD